MQSSLLLWHECECALLFVLVNHPKVATSGGDTNVEILIVVVGKEYLDDLKCPKIE